MINYKKESIQGYKKLNMFPVYSDNIYNGHEPFEIVGIRENEVEIYGDFSGGTHEVRQKSWVKDEELFVVREVCHEQLKPSGCQVHNVHCCGGGEVIKKHVHYWLNLI